MSPPIRSASGRVPSYRLHKPSGRAVVTLNCKDGNRTVRKDVPLGRHGTPESYRKYNEIIAEWLKANRTAEPLPRSNKDATIGGLMVRFWEQHVVTYYLRDGVPTSEQENYRQALRSLRALYEDLPVIDFTPPKLKTWLSSVTQPMRTVLDPITGEPRQVRGWCRTHANKQLSRIKAMFKWGMGEPLSPDSNNSLVPPDVHAALDAVNGLRKNRSHARESEKVRAVPDAFVEAVMPFLPLQIRAMIMLQIHTGARPGEIVAMTTGQIDTSGKQWVYRPTHHKTEHHDIEREIEIGARARAFLDPLLKPELAAFIFSPAEAEAQRLAEKHELRKTPASQGNRPGYNRTARSGQPRRVLHHYYDVGAYRRAIQRACEKADRWAKGGRVIGDDERLVPRWHPHQLRHNAATNIRAAFPEFGLEAAAAVLGHRTLSATQVYAERNARLARTVASQIG